MPSTTSRSRLSKPLTSTRTGTTSSGRTRTALSASAPSCRSSSTTPSFGSSSQASWSHQTWRLILKEKNCLENCIKIQFWFCDMCKLLNFPNFSSVGKLNTIFKTIFKTNFSFRISLKWIWNFVFLKCHTRFRDGKLTQFPLPGIFPRLLTLVQFYYLPLVRELLLSMGCCAASKRGVESLLRFAWLNSSTIR